MPFRYSHPKQEESLRFNQNKDIYPKYLKTQLDKKQVKPFRILAQCEGVEQRQPTPTRFQKLRIYGVLYRPK